MNRRTSRILGGAIIIAAAPHIEPPRVFIDRHLNHGQPRSFKETRRAQRRGRR